MGFCGAEHSKLDQVPLQADVYSGLRDVVLGDREENLNLAEHGQRIILPSSFSGGEHYMTSFSRTLWPSPEPMASQTSSIP